MSDTAIRVEGISKEYHIRHGVSSNGRRSYSTMRDAIASGVSAGFQRLRGFKNEEETFQTFWALKDVSFEIKKGETCGIIGANGAGKSTLLKVLARITEPTSGSAEIHGRVGSLLEVGTGFHAELTGRENIFMNGSILGMRRYEISKKFDEIVQFAEVEQFIDTAVKHYSSGMYLRLAFSVAAHLEPEILLVDEVLAVGDMKFQRKCLGKMEDVATQGRTVLFVSHNLGAIKELCRSSVVLKNGKVDFRGPVVQGLACYSKSMIDISDEVTLGKTRWVQIKINGQLGDPYATISGSEPSIFEGVLDVQKEYDRAFLFLIIENASGETVVHRRICADGTQFETIKPGRLRVQVELPPLWMAPGVYTQYFKFTGTRNMGEDRQLSDRITVNVEGDAEGISKANLAPSARWVLAPELLPDRQREVSSRVVR